MANQYGWIGVDLDGTLAHYTNWNPDGSIGEPIQPMVDRVKRWLAEGQTVKIFTARVAVSSGKEQVIKKIKAWCKKYIGQELEVTNIKDHAMIQLWDDRAVQVERNTGRIIGNK
jgi:hypothetical protein